MSRLLRNGAVGLGLMMVSAMALADNVLQDVRYAAAPGGKVDITLQFSSPVGEVQAFTTDSPPRIALDLPNTSNGLSARRVVIGSGATSAVSAAEAGGRTRVVVDLLRPAGYVTHSSGNLLVITVDAPSVTPVIPSREDGEGMPDLPLNRARGIAGRSHAIDNS